MSSRVSVPLEDCETLYVSSDHQTSTIQVAKSVIDIMDWQQGVDNTPWKNACLVSREGDTVYYLYPKMRASIKGGQIEII